MSGFSANIPVLETERLIMRGWRESDVQMIDHIYSDEENSRYVGGLQTRAQSWRYVAAQFGHWAMRGFGMWVLERKDTKEVAGYSGLWRPEGWPEQEVGYILDRRHFGHGFGAEAASRALKYAYRQLGWKTAISMIDKRNDASKKVARKLGAHFEQVGHMFGDKPAEIWRHLPPEKFLERFQ